MNKLSPLGLVAIFAAFCFAIAVVSVSLNVAWWFMVVLYIVYFLGSALIVLGAFATHERDE